MLTPKEIEGLKKGDLLLFDDGKYRIEVKVVNLPGEVSWRYWVQCLSLNIPAFGWAVGDTREISVRDSGWRLGVAYPFDVI
jgi:hypothetical protein